MGSPFRSLLPRSMPPGGLDETSIVLSQAAQGMPWSRRRFQRVSLNAEHEIVTVVVGHIEDVGGSNHLKATRRQGERERDRIAETSASFRTICVKAGFCASGA